MSAKLKQNVETQEAGKKQREEERLERQAYGIDYEIDRYINWQGLFSSANLIPGTALIFLWISDNKARVGDKRKKLEELEESLFER